MLQIRRILQLKSNGKSNRDIARELSLSRDTDHPGPNCAIHSGLNGNYRFRLLHNF